ncbi:hypothetical protein E5288_WYG021833 [Bos mutus]|uniref:G-protein coupled receptors family 1 profile domain-containing protein n=1 Tax=Bos mutus TaxID=72004 RepID=A0A6B0SA04_9CETA|nr:hypothetical protein [Bos mutus]
MDLDSLISFDCHTTSSSQNKRIYHQHSEKLRLLSQRNKLFWASKRRDTQQCCGSWAKTSFRTEIESRSTRHINGTRCFQRTEENDPGPGFQASTPEVLSKLDQGEPWMMDDETHCQTRSGYQSPKPIEIFKLKQGGKPWIERGNIHDPGLKGLECVERLPFSDFRSSSSEENHQSLRPDSMSARDLAIAVIFLSQTIFGMLGNFSVLYHYFFLYCTGQRLRTIDLIVKNLIVANILVLFSGGFHDTVKNFEWHFMDSDFACRFFPYVRVVGRGVSIGTTFLLSVFQAITISPRTAKWAELKVKALKCMVPSVILCWTLNMLVNVIYPMYMSGTLRNRSITNRKDLGHCSAVSHGQPEDSLYAVLLSFPDALCFVLMILASGSTVFILYRHKQRVQNFHRTNISSISSPESRATKTILLLVIFGLEPMFRSSSRASEQTWFWKDA